jgi:hypothetical protein
MIKYLVLFIFTASLSFAQNVDTNTIEEAKADCLILKEKNSIICKFEAITSNVDEQVIVQWIDPQGDISRSRDMIVPAGHLSIYDFRYLEGRLSGSWTFKVITKEKEYTTKFELN